jgi:hypothetical protein
MKEGSARTVMIPDSMDGIRFTVGRMVKMIQDARKSPVMISMGQKISSMAVGSRKKKKARQREEFILRGIHAWCRENFTFVNDPVGVECIQTPERMMRNLDIPRQVQKAIWDPIGKALGGRMPPPRMTGDADDITVLALSMAAAVGISPLYVVLGGDKGSRTIMTCWCRADVRGKVYDFDVLSEKFGKPSGWDEMEKIEVPL